MSNISDVPAIGIIGGAGPMAGLLLAKKIIQKCQQKYGCVNDADFPKILLHSIPFAPMLNPTVADLNHNQVAYQLNEAINILLSNKVKVLLIACNTLHSFISKPPKELMSLISLTEKYIMNKKSKATLVLGTSTTAARKIYNIPSLVFPDDDAQNQMDQIIAQVLAGHVSETLQLRCQQIIQKESNKNPAIQNVILGCTELSVLFENKPTAQENVLVIDPMEIMADCLCNQMGIDSPMSV